MNRLLRRWSRLSWRIRLYWRARQVAALHRQCDAIQRQCEVNRAAAHAALDHLRAIVARLDEQG